MCCSSCGQSGALFNSGGDTVCEECAWSAMEHGHRHVHDEPGHCLSVLSRVGGGDSLVLRCPVPMAGLARYGSA